jgi:hypothetical protein
MSSGSGVGKICENVSWDGRADDGSWDDVELDGGVVNDDGGAEVGEGPSDEKGMLELGNPVDAGSVGHGDEGAEEVVGDWSHESLLTWGWPESAMRLDRVSADCTNCEL